MVDNSGIVNEILTKAEDVFNSAVVQGVQTAEAFATASEKALEYALSLGLAEEDANTLFSSAQEALILKLLKASQLEGVHSPEVELLRLEFAAQEAAHELFNQLQASGTAYPDAVNLSADLAYNMAIDSGFSSDQAQSIALKVRESLARSSMASNELTDGLAPDAALTDWDGEKDGYPLEEEPLLRNPDSDLLQEIGRDFLSDITGAFSGPLEGRGDGLLSPIVDNTISTPSSPPRRESDDDTQPSSSVDTPKEPPQELSPESPPEPPSTVPPTKVVVLPPKAIASVAALQTSVLEGADDGSQILQFIISRSNDIGSSSVNWGVAGDVSGADFGETELPSGTVHFLDGESSKVISVTVEDDYLIEGPETLTVILSDPGANLLLGSASSASTLIHDDEVGFQITADRSGVTEGAAGETVMATFTVTRSVDVDTAATINFRAIPYGSSPASLNDFVSGQDGLIDNGGLPSGTVSFVEGETTKSINIQLAGDNAAGPDEGFAVVLYDPPPDTLILTDTAPMTVLNDDGFVSISTVETVQNEGSSSSSSAFQFIVTRSGSLLSATQVDYAVAPFGETQIQVGDIDGSVFSTGTVSFAAGQRQATVTIDVAGDSLLEGNEDFEVYLLNPGDNLDILNGTAVATIRQDDAAVKITPLDAIRLEGNDTPAPHTFEIIRSGNLDQITVVDWTVQSAGITPAIADDFGPGFPSGSVVFSAGETVKIITVTPIADVTYESVETYDVVISLPNTGAVLLNNSAQGTILNDEAGFSLSGTSLALTEGHSGTTLFSFTINRSGTTDSEVSVDWALSAADTNGVQESDFAGGTFPSGSVTFESGVSSRVISFEVATDNVVEEDESYNITLSNASVGSDIVVGETTGTIYNDDAGFSIEAVESEKSEGQAGETLVTFTITRTGDTGSIDSVSYSVIGSGLNPADAADFGGSLPSGTVIFNPTETSKTLTVAVSGDDQIENDETFTVTLESPSEGSELNAGEESATATILDDDDQFSIESVVSTVEEGGESSSGTVVFNINRTGSLDTSSTVEWTITGRGSEPTESDDFTAVSGVVTFAAGESSQQIEAQIDGDFVIESDEDFTITLSNASIGSTLGADSFDGTIINDDVGLALSSATTDLTEGDSGSKLHTFTVVRTGVTTGVTTVDWAVSGSGGDAADATDFGGSFPTGTLTFGAGETSKDIQISSTGDTEIELNENFVVTLSNADGNADIHVATANGSIVADDIGISITAEQSSVTEGAVSDTQVLQFTVTRTGDLASPVEIDWAATGMDADDFSAGTVFGDRLSFGTNETSKVISLTLKGDAIKETDETLTVTLTNPAANPAFTQTSILTDTAQTSIVNDDADVSISAVTTSQDEGEPSVVAQTAFTFVVTRSGDTSVPSSLDWEVQVAGDEDSASVVDFTAGQNGHAISSGLPSGTVHFSAGETTAQITVLVATDDQVEKDELFDVILINPDDQTEISGSSSTVTILNDDTGFTIVAASAENSEGDTGETDFTFTVTRAGDLSLAATVDWAVTGSGTHPADISDFPSALPSGTISFGVDEAFKTLTIPVSGDVDVESDEEFTVTLTNALSGGNPQTIVDATATGTILNEDQEFAVSAANPSIAEASIGTTQIAFIVARTGDLSGTATIDYAVTGSNGANTTDIVGDSLPVGTLNFAVGEDQLSVVFDVIGDTLAENDETFTLTLSNQSAGGITTDVASTIIVNDDANYTLTAPVDAVEGESGTSTFTFTVARTGDTSGTGSVAWRVTSAAGLTTADFVGSQDVLADNSGLPSGTVNFAIGESSQDITINVQGDLDLESDETLEVVLSSPVNGTITTTTDSSTILTDDDSFSISTATSTMVEGNTDSSVTYTVTRTGSLDGARDVTWTITGVDGFDPATDLATGQAATDTISFADGQTTADIVINVKGDSALESDETMTVTLSGAPANTTFGTASDSTIITNDDASVSIAALQATKNEGNSSVLTGEVPGDISSEFSVGSNGIVTGALEVNGDDDWYRVNLTANHSYRFTMEGSDAGAGTLYPPEINGIYTEDGSTISGTYGGWGSGSAIGLPGLSAYVPFTPDTSGTYFVSAQSHPYFSGTYTLTVSDQTTPGADVSIPPITLVPYTFTITRSGNLDQESTVDWRVGDGSNPVTADDFYGVVDEIGDNGGLPSGEVTFAATENSITVTINVLSDSILENDEALRVTLSDPSTGTEIGTAVADGVVENDDAELNITAGTASLVEGDAGHGTAVAYTYTVTRTGNLDQTTTVDWSVVHDTTNSSDFTNGSSTTLTPSGTLTFGSGIAAQTITVYGYGDTGVGSVEDDEAFSVQLSNANPGSSIGSTGVFDSEIVNDDTQLTLSVDDYSKAEAKAGESTTYTYTVTRTGDLTKTTAFSWSVAATDPETGNPGYVYDYTDGYRFEYVTSTNDFLGSSYPTGNGIFAVGESTKTFTVNIQGDDTPENDEWFVTSLTATNGYDQIQVVYDNPDEIDGTQLLRTYYGHNYYRDNEEISSSSNGVSSNTNYLFTSIERDEAEFSVLDREVVAEGDHTLLNSHLEGDTLADGGSDDLVAHVFAVQRTITTAGTASVDWRATPYSNAPNADDFADGSDARGTGDLASGTVNFTDGQEWAYITIYTKPDNTGEYDESFHVYLENPSGGSSINSNDDGYPYNIGYITNDDTRFDASVNDVIEGNTLTYTITRQGDSRGTDTIDWALTFPGTEATNESNNDYTTWYQLDPSDVSDPVPENGTATYDGTSIWSGTLTFADGETTKTITVDTIDDAFAESWREELPITLSNATNIDDGEANHDLETATTGYTDSAEVYDNEPDPILALSVDQTELFEGTAAGATYSDANIGNTVTFTVTRTDQDGDTLDYSSTVGWYLSGSNVNYSVQADIRDYGTVNRASEYNNNTTYGNVYFGSGETEKDITITFNGDNYVEGDETLTFRLMEADQAEYSGYYDVYGSSYADQNGYGPANIDTSTENNYIEQQVTLKNDDIRLWVDDWDSDGTDGYATNLNVEGYEGNDLTFNMVRAGRTDVDVTVGYTISNGSTANGDFTSMTGSFTLEALGYSYSSNVTQAVTIEDFFIDDTIVEGNENFTLTLSTPADEAGSSVFFQSYAHNSTAWNNGYSGKQTTIDVAGTINDDDTTYTLSTAATSLVESDDGADQTFSFTLDRVGTGYTGPATVYWRVEAVGTNPADVSDFSTGDTQANNGGLPSGSVSFADGDLSEQFSVLVDGDLIYENNETFRVVVYEDILTGPDPAITTSQSIATAELTITNDDNGLTIGDAALTETDSDQTLTFTVNRSGDTSVISTAHWSLAYGTALAADFSGATEGDLTFNTGVTSQTIDVTVEGDITPEDIETFTIQLSNFVEVDDLIDIEAEGTINNDDATFELSAGTIADEGEGQVFTVTRTHSTDQDQVINWTVSADNADVTDFGGTLPTGSVTFTSGELSKTFTITSNADSTAETDEDYTVSISLGAGTTGDTITTDTVSGTIVNDDAAFSIETDQIEALEDHSGDTAFTFTVTRSGSTTGTGSVEWRLSSGAASSDDFTSVDERGDNGGLPSGIVNFADGESSKTITINVSGDEGVETDELFTVTLSDGVNGSVLTGTADATILNDDSTIVISALDAVKAEGDAGNVTFTFNVNRTGYLGEAETVDYVVTGNGVNPADAVDFGGAFPNGTLTLPADQADTTLVITVTGDQLAELDEDFQVTLSDPSSGVTLGTATAIGTIQADDVVFDVSSPGDQTEGNPGDSNNLEFIVTRSGDLSGSQTLNWSVTGISADPTDDNDFVVTSGTVTFDPTDTTQTIQVDLEGDYEGEANEAFRLTLTGPAEVVFNNDTADAVILDDDASLRISATNAVKQEGGVGDTTTFAFTVERTGNNLLEVDVDWDVDPGGAVDASDFLGGVFPGGTLHFAANETTQTIEVEVSGDVLVEQNEMFNVVLSNASTGADIIVGQASGTIMSDDVDWGIAPATIPSAEGDGVTDYVYTVTRTGSETATTIAWSVAGAGLDSASADDFVGDVLPSGSLVFAQGVMSQDVTVQVNGDSDFEPGEDFIIRLAAPTDGLTHSFSQQSTTTTIENDDDVLALSTDSVDNLEGSGGLTNFTFTVMRSGSLTGESSVGWQIVDVDTTAADFDATSGTVSFVDGQDTATITVLVTADRDVENDETFTVVLQSPGDGSTIDSSADSVSGIIRTDDIDVTLSAITDSAVEGDLSGGQLQYLLTRSGDLTQESSADWALAGDVNAADFSGPVSGTVLFAAGESQQVITLNVAPDGDNEGNEDFTLVLSNPSVNVDFIDNGLAGQLINDDDSLSITAVDADKDEGDGSTTPFTFEITRSGSFAGTASVIWSVVGVGANAADNSNFAQLTDSVTFADGETSKIITVPVIGDNYGEPDQEFTVTLSDPSFGSTVVSSSALGTIQNDDAALYIIADQVDKLEGAIGDSTTFTFTVTRDGGLDAPSSVNWAVVPAGANPVQALDFGGFFPSGEVSFAVGQSSQQISINVTGDFDGEDDESFQIVLSDAVNADIIVDTATTTILNDDSALTISALDSNKLEGNTGETVVFTFVVDRVGPLTGEVTVDWRVSGSGTYWADAADFMSGQDLLGNSDLPSGSLVLGDGVLQKTIEITVVGDSIPGNGEGFTVTLENPTGATLVNDTVDAVIENDDSQFSITAENIELNEGNPGLTTTFDFVVARTGYVDSDSSVSWRVVGEGDNPAGVDDFVGDNLPSGTLNFASGESSHTVSIDVKGDYYIESQEGFSVEIFGPADNATVNSAGSIAKVNIINDDVGTAESDILIGTASADELTGLGESDTLTGGDGADRFRYTSAEEGIDHITDFEVGDDKLALNIGSFGTLGTTGPLVVADAQGFDTDVDTTLSQLAAQADADYYRVDFGTGNFTIGLGDDGHLDELEAAFTDSDSHSGSAIIAVSNGDTTTHVFFDEDTASGVDGEGLEEIAILDNVADATTMTEDNVDVQVA